jgi:hypothetical protein
MPTSLRAIRFERTSPRASRACGESSKKSAVELPMKRFPVTKTSFDSLTRKP